MPARDDDKAMEGLLRRSLARDAAAGECPDADILAAYYEHSLDADEAAGYEQHIAQCTKCREHIAAMVRAESALEIPAEQEIAVRAAALAPPAKAAIPASATSPPKTKHSWVFGLRLLAPAAALMVIAVFVFVHYAQREGRSLLPNNEVAMSKPATVPQPTPSQDLSAPAERGRTPRAVQQIPASPAVKKAAPPVPSQTTPPPPAREEVPEQPHAAAAIPAGKPPATPHTYGGRASGGRPSGFVGGAMIRGGAGAATTSTNRVAPAGRPATLSHTAAASAAPPANTQASNTAQPAAAPSPGLASRVVGATSPSPPPAAKKEAAPAAASAQSAESTSSANDKTKAPAQGGAATGEAIGSVAETVELRGSPGSTESVAITTEVAPLYRVTPEGAIERSNNGGASWKAQRLKTDAPIVALSAPSGKICWAVGRGGIILLTKNGKSWKKISPPTETDLTGITALDGRSAVVTAMDGRKFSTVDSGKHWDELK